MKKVNILMPTYNGEKYLRQQLDSIVNQTYKQIDCYIRDDGSTDGTVSIIDEYCNRDFFEIKFYKVESRGINLGYPDCFWELLKSVPKADYYAFCDQDDLWNENKIQNAVKKLNEVSDNVPAMTFCSFDYYDSNMNYIRSGSNYKNGFNFKRGLYYTYAPGFTQVINNALVELLDFDFILHKQLAHDIWCQWIASSIGEVLFEETKLANYRRHDMAVTSANASYFQSLKRWWDKEIKGSEMEKWHQSLVYFKESYYELVKTEEKKTLDIFIGNKKIINKIQKVFYYKRLRPTFGGEMALRLLFLLGKC